MKMGAGSVMNMAALIFKTGPRPFGHVATCMVQSDRLFLPPLASLRGVHSQPITRNLQYISNDKLDLRTDKKTLKLHTPVERPLCIVLSWMASKQKHLMKYADIYLRMGFDVVTVTVSPWQLMWPVTGSQVVAANLMKFLESNGPRPLVVHGFSVGAYVWAELLVHALNDPQRWQPVLDRVAAQVWDSPADIHEIPVGLPLALFPRSQAMQAALSAYVRAHMRLFHRMATRHYMAASEAYHAPPCRAPALFLVSTADPVGAPHRSRSALASMTAIGMKCNWQCWEDSPHVLHYSWHPEEYLKTLFSHLEECGVHTTDRGQPTAFGVRVTTALRN